MTYEKEDQDLREELKTADLKNNSEEEEKEVDKICKVIEPIKKEKEQWNAIFQTSEQTKKKRLYLRC